MTVSKTLLLLGGSRQQVVAIERATELGYRTVVCDYLPDNPGQNYADVFYPVSTTDCDAVLEIAKKEKIDGILAYSSDPASPVAGYVAEKMGLPTNPLSSIQIMSEKHLFRRFLYDSGLPCPKMVDFTKNDSLAEVGKRLASLRYPIVVKPTDASGSKGVSILEEGDCLASAISYASEYSRNGVLIAEEFIERSYPNVIGGDIFVVEGEVRFWGLMECLRDEELGGLVPVGEYLPPRLTSIDLSAVKGVLQKLVSLLDIQFGELNVEVIIGKGGVPYVIELGSRAGGNMIPVQLSDASGIDLIAANILCALGENPGDLFWDSSISNFCGATYVLHSNVDGILRGISKSNRIERSLYREVLYKSLGDNVSKFDGANKAIGIVFMRFNTPGEMHELLTRVSKEIMPIVE